MSYNGFYNIFYIYLTIYHFNKIYKQKIMKNISTKLQALQYSDKKYKNKNKQMAILFRLLDN